MRLPGPCPWPTLYLPMSYGTETKHTRIYPSPSRLMSLLLVPGSEFPGESKRNKKSRGGQNKERVQPVGPSSIAFLLVYWLYYRICLSSIFIADCDAQPQMKAPEPVCRRPCTPRT